MTPEQQREARKLLQDAWKSGKMTDEDVAFFKEAAPIVGLKLKSSDLRGKGPRRRWTPEMWKAYDERKKLQDDGVIRKPGTSDLIANAAAFGWADEISAGIQTPFSYAWDRIKGRRTSFSDLFDRNWAEQQASLDTAKENAGGGGQLFAGIAGGLSGAAPAKVAATAANAVVPLASQLKEGAKWGGIYGALYGAGEAEGNVAERLPSAALGGLIGAGSGAATVAGLRGIEKHITKPISRRRRLSKIKTARQAREAEQDFIRAGVEPFTPALSPSETTRATAAKLQGTVFGSSLNRAANNTMDGLEQAVTRAVPRQTADQSGSVVQKMVKDQVDLRSLSKEQVEALSPAQRSSAIGLGLAHKRYPSPPERPDPATFYEEPTLPTPRKISDAEVEAAMPQTVRPELKIRELTEAELQPDLALATNYQKHLGLFRQIDQQHRKIETRLEDLRAEHGKLAQEFNDIAPPRDLGMPAGPARDRHRESNKERFDKWHQALLDRGITPAQASDRIRQIEPRLRQIESERAALSKKLTAIDIESQRASFQKTHQEFTEAKNKKVHEAAQKAQREAQEAADLEYKQQRDQDFLDTRKRLEDAEEQRVSHYTTQAGYSALEREARRKADALADEHFKTLKDNYAELKDRLDVNQDAPFQLGRSGESYKTEFDIAYTHVDENAPTVLRNILGARNDTQLSNTAQLLDELAQTQRRLLRMPGYKNGRPFDENGAVRPEILSALSERAGPELANVFRALSERRRRGQFTPSISGVREIRTLIGQALGDIRRAKRHDPTSKTTDEAFLERLYGAVAKDLQTFLKEAPDGLIAARQYAQVDEAYRQYLTEIRRPLRVVFGEKITPEQAIQRLVKATTKDEGDINLLRQFLRIADDRGERQVAVNAILSHMSQDGVSKFMKALVGMSGTAQRELFSGVMAPLGKQLQAILAAENRMRRFQNRQQPGLDSLARQGAVAGVLGYISTPAVVTAALGSEVAARVLASQAFKKWLLALPRVRSKTVPHRTRHALRLHAILLEQGGVNDAVAGSILEEVNVMLGIDDG